MAEDEVDSTVPRGYRCALENMLHDDLLVQVLSFLPARELARVESTSKRFRRLPMSLLWRKECIRIFPRHYVYDDDAGVLHWKARYRFIKEDLRRSELTTSELEGLDWQFYFIPQHSNFGVINNTSGGLLQRSPCYFIDGRLYILEYLWRFALLEAELIQYEDGGDNVNGEAQIVSNLLWENKQYPYLVRALGRVGLSSLDPSSIDDVRCSYLQCLRVADFALHSVARTRGGGWIIWSKHVVITSTGSRREEGALPEQLQEHLALLQQFDW